MTRGGFEMSVRFARSRRGGQQAGTLTPSDLSKMQVIESEDHKLHYIQKSRETALRPVVVESGFRLRKEKDEPLHTHLHGLPSVHTEVARQRFMSILPPQPLRRVAEP